MLALSLLDRAGAAGAKITPQRKVICHALECSGDHPDVDQLLARARESDPGLSLASVYRTLRTLEDLGLVWKHDFGDGRARYEVRHDDHHDHLIDTISGQIVEFHDPELEALKKRIAARLGYRLEGHSLALFGRPADGESQTP